MDSTNPLNIEDLKNAIFKSLTLIQKQDQILLEIDIYEVCLMHRFALYLERYFSPKCPTYQFDIEYTRFGERHDSLKFLKSFYEKMFAKWQDILKNNPTLAKDSLRRWLGRKKDASFESWYETTLKIKESGLFIEREMGSVRPDLIIHHRLKNELFDNLCVFEAKLKEPIKDRKKEFSDIDKVTCFMEDLNYQYGIILNFIPMEWQIYFKDLANANRIVHTEINCYDKIK